MRCGLGKPDKDKKKKECQMNPEFDPEYPTRRNRPISHLKTNLSYLYSI
jgi:hypothetical protein